ncbi:D-3-phosphoglycerate dehydrogenase domain protein [Mycobacterium ulcerans str. Harvey]|uniref:D-3-phosphoglycerate dehydrogenase domain protein n=1 Tax=Mycobacterium ulcerans str. Harvey TaxID=1299332 RepID=A0ABN0RAE1_MYCUL|nr:D-3-phosphoglycerate dehydrogenase domain protein [Mycobacterium ulcerans str. Harvey]
MGKIGTLLGAAGVNIHAAQLSEDVEGRAPPFCCAWTRMCLRTCVRPSPPRWAPTGLKLSISREPRR